tara:strand:- start:3 stop:557 length:555 start_codon:yes stop_codon:yes gene_type:complete
VLRKLLAIELLFHDAHAGFREHSDERFRKVLLTNKPSSVQHKVESTEARVEALGRAFQRWHSHQSVIHEPFVYMCKNVLVASVLDVRLLDGNSERVVRRKRGVFRKVVVHKNPPPTFGWVPCAEQGEFAVEVCAGGMYQVTNEHEAGWGAGGGVSVMLAASKVARELRVVAFSKRFEKTKLLLG